MGGGISATKIGLWTLLNMFTDTELLSYRQRNLNEGSESKLKTRKTGCVGLCYINKLKRLQEMIKHSKGA